MEKMTFDQVQTVIKTMAGVAEKNEAYFCELDGVMGDADFGVSLATGFKSVMDKWDSYDMTDIGSFLMGVTTAITSCTGGCSGAGLDAGASPPQPDRIPSVKTAHSSAAHFFVFMRISF